MFYVWFDAPIEYIAATSGMGRSGRRTATGSRWWRTDKGADDVTLRRVHGQGQRRLPHRQLPRHHPGLGRAVEAGRHAQGLQLAELVRRQVLHLQTSAACSWTQALELLPPDYWRWYLIANSPESSRHRPSPGSSSPGAVNSRPGRRAGQFRQPHPEVHREQVRRRGPRRRRGRARWRRSCTPTSRPAWRISPNRWRPSRCASAPRPCAPLWVVGNEYLTGGRALDGDQDRPRSRRGDRPHGLNLAALFAQRLRAVHPVRRREDRRGFLASRGRRPGPRRTRPRELSILPVGLAVRAPEVLFKKIEDEQIAEWTARFGGAE